MFDYAYITKQTDRAKVFFEDKLSFTLGPVELKKMIGEETVQIIDVRRKEDYDNGHISTAISIPGAELENNMDKLSKDQINIVYCYTQQCHLAARAAVKLATNGYPVMELEGGFDVWKNAYNFEVTTQ